MPPLPGRSAVPLAASWPSVPSTVPRVAAILPWSATPAGCTSADTTDNRRFLDELAQAERRHDYRPLPGRVRPASGRPPRRSARATAAARSSRWGAREYDGALADFDETRHRPRPPCRRRPARLAGDHDVRRAPSSCIRREQHDTAAEAERTRTPTARADGAFTDALNDLAWIRATNPDAALRNGHQKRSCLARRACANGARFGEIPRHPRGPTRRPATPNGPPTPRSRPPSKQPRFDARTRPESTRPDFLADAIPVRRHARRIVRWHRVGRYRETPVDDFVRRAASRHVGFRTFRSALLIKVIAR